MTQEQRLKLIATAARLVHGEDWLVTASYDGSREHAWTIERRAGSRDTWIGRGVTLDDALITTSKAYVELLRKSADAAVRIASQLEA